MSSSVYLQGATYSGVPSIVVPSDSNGNTASFYHLKNVWLPPSATLVASAAETINLSSGTSYDSWTPTTTNTSILEEGATRGACSYTITTDYQDTALIGLCLQRTVITYPDGTTYAKGYSLRKNIMAVCHYAPFKDECHSDSYYGHCATMAYYSQKYHSSASATTIYTGSSYGIGANTCTWSTSSATSTSSRVVGFTRPIIYARCNSSYFSTTAAAAVDSANSYIYTQYLIYSIDKTESPLYKLFDETSGMLFNRAEGLLMDRNGNYITDRNSAYISTMFY